MTLHDSLKGFARLVATIVVLPIVGSTLIRGWLLGRDRAFQGSVEWLSALPGIGGQYARRAYLAFMTEGCGDDTVIGYGTLFSTARVQIDGNAYIGPHCDIGWAHIERDALLAAGVHIPSGPTTHGLAQLDVPIRDQPGDVKCIRVGEGAWVGNGAIVMADVGRHAVVAAGAVVTKPIPDYGVAAGVPAKVIRSRLPGDGALA